MSLIYFYLVELLTGFGRRSSRSKRKMERKVGSGRKGTVDEEEYLLRSIGKLVGRFSGTRSTSLSLLCVRYELYINSFVSGEGKKLLPHLIRFTAQHREDGLAMQRKLSEFEVELSATVEEIWPASTDAVGIDGQTQTMQPLQDTWAVRMDDAQRQQKINPTERIAKPQVDGDGDEKDWKMKLFDLI